MYRPSDPQRDLFDAGGLLPPEKRERCAKSWAGPFREKALPILRSMEGEFAGLFDPEMGRPNRPVELVLAVLILKEAWDLTDQETLDALEFDARWWWALDREPRELRLSQKTMHNFRVGVTRHGKAKVAFRRMTDTLIPVLGVEVGRQRLDSTQILSNIAVLTRLGLFCETLRVFLRAAKEAAPREYAGLPVGILRRHGEEAAYADARREEGRRRLAVVARDVWRLVRRFETVKAVTAREEWTWLKRLYEEQCEVKETPPPADPGADDAGDGAAPVEVKAAKEVASDSLQTPHDAEATYSGHKGKGYAVQVLETCGAENAVDLIVDVEVTPACRSDQDATVPMVDAAAKAGHAPVEVVADTGFSGAANAAEVAARDATLTAPVCGKWKPEEGKTYPAPEKECPMTEEEALEWQKRQQASPNFRERYAIRAGIEATNSELKRGHGLGKLRVRREARVKLAVYFKALACNVKRALRYWLAQARAAEGVPVLV